MEDSILKPTSSTISSDAVVPRVSNFEVMFDVHMQAIPRLHLLALNDISIFKQSEISVMRLMKSDEGELMEECRNELKKAKLLRKKLFPIRTRIELIKAMVWPRSR